MLCRGCWDFAYCDQVLFCADVVASVTLASLDGVVPQEEKTYFQTMLWVLVVLNKNM